MGLDTSSHAIDVDLIQKRLIPHILGDHPIDDLIAHAVQNKLASTRANAWAIALLDVSHALSDANWKQEEQAKPVSFFSKLLGRKPEAPRIMPLHLPDFDSDLHVWGRPFFIHAGSHEEAAQRLDDWLKVAREDDAAIDALALKNLRTLEASRQRAIAGETPERAALLSAVPRLDTLTPQPHDASDVILSADQIASNMRNAADTMRRIATAAGPDEVIGQSDFGDDLTAGYLQERLPYDLINFYAAILPGWMSRGYGFASHVLGELGAADGLFETPERLFAPLGERCPNFAEQLHATIPENYALGGYVPPERLGDLIAALDTHRRDYALYFDQRSKADKARISDADLADLECDWRKVRETAEYARRHGYGYLEGAEVYSGFLGQMN